MLKYLVITLVTIGVALFWIYSWTATPKIFSDERLEFGVPYIYKNTNQKIGDIKISAFYFVPKNKQDAKIDDWRKIIETNLQKLSEFHNLQLQSRSRITYETYPEPIIGRENNSSYDTDVTQHGNPEALKRVAREIEERVLNMGGDKYLSDFGQKAQAYHVLAIVYEGVGASGSDNVAFVSRTFLSSPEYGSVGATILAHEFYHTLGVPDFYEIPSAIPLSSDIMGAGIERPIEKAYISREVLKNFGL